MAAECKGVVSQTTLLVPIRYPLRTTGIRTVLYASDLAERFDDAHLVVLHVNAIHNGKHITPAKLRRAVEEEVGPLLAASYQVCDSFLIENAILEEAAHRNTDYVVIGRSARSRWRQVLARRLGLGIDLETHLEGHLDTELVVVSGPDECDSVLAPLRQLLAHFRGR